MRYLLPFTSFAIMAVAILWGVWNWSYRDALGQLVSEGEGRLALASDRLVGRLERYRQLPLLLTSNPLTENALGLELPALHETDLFLERIADASGALDILLIDASGIVKAAADWREDTNFIGSDFSDRPDFQRAKNGALGFYHSKENGGDPRGFYFTSAVRSDGNIIGAISVKVDLEELEAEWRGDPENIFFTDEFGVVFISNRDSLILNIFDLGEYRASVPVEPARYSVEQLGLSPTYEVSQRFGNDIWQIDNHDELPPKSLYLELPLPVIGMDGHVLLDLTAVEQEARLRTALVGLLLILFMVLLTFLLQHRRDLAARLQIEENAKAELEERVLRRTAQLQSAQDDLVQAGKLSALGQMSAGISHELNQPLAAIQSYAENAVILLDRGRSDDAGANLLQISSMAARMGRIIRNLRSFAKKEGEAASRVDLVKVVQDAIELADIRLRESGVDVQWQEPDDRIIVWGGVVRLQQVVLNLITNAADAMQGQSDGHIWIDVATKDKSAILQVRDNGPGLENLHNIFEPFYTTKSVGDGDGMGLGLSISYGIVQSFGGKISGENHKDGGAVFTMKLELTGPEGNE